MTAKCHAPDCRANPSKDTGWCFFHDPSPEAAAKRKEAHSEGGKKSRQSAPAAKALGEDAPGLRLETKADFLTLMSLTINQVRMGQLGTETGRVVGYLAGVALKALDEGDTDDRLKRLEEQVRLLTSVPTDELLSAARAATVNGIPPKPGH